MRESRLSRPGGKAQRHERLWHHPRWSEKNTLLLLLLSSVERVHVSRLQRRVLRGRGQVGRSIGDVAGDVHRCHLRPLAASFLRTADGTMLTTKSGDELAALGVHHLKGLHAPFHHLFAVKGSDSQVCLLGGGEGDKPAAGADVQLVCDDGTVGPKQADKVVGVELVEGELANKELRHDKFETRSDEE